MCSLCVNSVVKMKSRLGCSGVRPCMATVGCGSVRRAWCCMTASNVWWCGAAAGAGSDACMAALTSSVRSAASRSASAEPGSACSARRRSSTYRQYLVTHCHNLAFQAGGYTPSYLSLITGIGLILLLIKKCVLPTKSHFKIF